MHVRLLHGDTVSPNRTSVRHEDRKAGTDGKRTRRQRLRSSRHWGEAVGEGEGEGKARPGKSVLLLDVQEGGEAGPSTSEATAAVSRAVPPPAGKRGTLP